VAFHKFHALLSARLSQALRNMNLENAHEWGQKSSNFDFLERYHKDGD
jgi:hypothetical protein